MRNIGDMIWTYRVQWLPTLGPCPVCTGSGYLMVKPFGAEDAAGQRWRCEYCNRESQENGTHFHPGQVIVAYGYKVLVQDVRIDGMNARAGKPVEYLYGTSGGSSYICYADQAFDDAATAAVAGEAAARAATIAHEAECMRQHEWGRQSTGRLGWTIGYHAAAVRNARREVDYHIRMLNLAPAEYDAWVSSIEDTAAFKELQRHQKRVRKPRKVKT
jgi:transposase-like protein